MKATYYSVLEFKPGAGTFVDTPHEDVATAELYNIAADEHSMSAYVLYSHPGDFYSVPTHALLNDVLYKLVEVEEESEAE